jgi:hypothetical protein
MRFLFFSLLVANVIFFAYVQSGTGDAQPAGERTAKLQVRPENIRIIRAGDTPDAGAARPAMRRSAAPEAPAPSRAVCLDWSGVAAQDAERARLLLDSLEARYEVARAGGTGEAYWVQIPGLRTREEADEIVRRLRAAGERDFAVSRNAAQGTYYISLGFFRNEEGAKRQQSRFQALGAIITPHEAVQSAYLVRDAAPEIADRIAAAASRYPGSTTTQVPCPAPRTAGSDAQ